MEFYTKDEKLGIHNKNQNCLTLEISFADKPEEIKTFNSILEPHYQSVINDACDNENNHIQVEHPFYQHIKFYHRFILKYLLHLIYDKVVYLKVICFDEELTFKAVFDTLSALLMKVDSTNIKIINDVRNRLIFVNDKIVYRTSSFRL